MEDNQQSSEAMTLESFRQMRESGINPYEQGETDAASQQQKEVTDQVQEQTDEQDINVQDDADISLNADTDVNNDEHIDIPEGQRTAFQKALEREKRKAKEAAEQQYKTEYETQLNPYKAFFEKLGTDPQQAMEAMEQTRIRQEAESLAYNNGWDEQQTQMYMRQQDLERKQTEMQVNLRVYELSETPDYPGIKTMKGAITDFIRVNPKATVEAAYWATGGPQLVQQMKREQEQRDIAKRSQPQRKVISDAPADMKGPAPLTPDAVAFMKRTGMSEDQVRFMMNDKGPQNLEDYRKMMKAKKG